MVKDYGTNSSAPPRFHLNYAERVETETVTHAPRTEVKTKPEMRVAVPHGAACPSPDPSEGFSQLFTELPSTPMFSPKKKTTLLLCNAPPHHLQIKAVHVSQT